MITKGSTLFQMMKFGVLVWPNLLTTYLMSIMATYLTGVWEISITHAAIIVNLYSGLVGIMPVGLKLLVDTFIGSFWVVLLSRFAFAAGLVLLTMSTPPVLSRATGTCNSYDPECIGRVQRILFYTGLPLIAVGVAGHLSSLMEFVESQIPPPTYEQLLPSQSNVSKPEADENDHLLCQIRSWKGFFFVMLSLLVPGVAIAIIGYVNPWSFKFGIPATFTVVSILIFTSGLCSYERPKPDPSILSRVFRKFDTRSIIWFIPLCMNFVLIGVVLSVGSTFFIEQATDLNPYVGKLLIPILILPAMQELTKKICAGPIEIFARLPDLSILWSIIFAALSCITAAKVETRRLNVVKSYGVLDEPEKIIPMTLFWLVPQFALLGLAEELADKTLQNVFVIQVEPRTLFDSVPAFLIGLKIFLKLDINDDEETKESNRKVMVRFKETMRSRRAYKESLAQAVKGVGIICGVLSVYLVGQISSIGGKPSWFQYTINRSRLDNYYWTLAALCATNLFCFMFLKCKYPQDPELLQYQHECREHTKLVQGLEELEDPDLVSDDVKAKWTAIYNQMATEHPDW
ncbi:protein NRT1/ PTR FAMILY 5.5-like [Argentina anserina]|uniref:protein NRT1/ PTR FAMILY 5.5-like n=1 Tax=Argentina anserina TaxID=57926 RepID=UPI00217684AD|nr:protein NRT1/ PTR FAMILY 5.5-like [Potentilla anserina]